MDGVIQSPQTLPGAGCPLPQAEVSRIREQCRIDNLEAKVVVNRPILQNFLNPFQAQDHFLVQLRILEIFNVLRVVTAFAKDIPRNRRDEDRPSLFQSMNQFWAPSQDLFGQRGGGAIVRDPTTW
jgi:hypothetical protein